MCGCVSLSSNTDLQCQFIQILSAREPRMQKLAINRAQIPSRPLSSLATTTHSLIVTPPRGRKSNKQDPQLLSSGGPRAGANAEEEEEEVGAMEGLYDGYLRVLTFENVTVSDRGLVHVQGQLGYVDKKKEFFQNFPVKMWRIATSGILISFCLWLYSSLGYTDFPYFRYVESASNLAVVVHDRQFFSKVCSIWCVCVWGRELY